jgi:hypothetical protein
MTATATSNYVTEALAKATAREKTGNTLIASGLPAIFWLAVLSLVVIVATDQGAYWYLLVPVMASTLMFLLIGTYSYLIRTGIPSLPRNEVVAYLSRLLEQPIHAWKLTAAKSVWRFLYMDCSVEIDLRGPSFYVTCGPWHSDWLKGEDKFLEFLREVGREPS